MSTKFMYLRANRQQNPVGCVAYTVNQKTGQASFQVSVVNPIPYVKSGGESYEKNGRQLVTKDRTVRDVFNRQTSRTLALAKLEQAPVTTQLFEAGSDVGNWSTTVELMKHLSCSDSIPNRACKEAAAWLRAHGHVKKNKQWVLVEQN